MAVNATQLQICIVEDEVDLREELVDTLLESGYGVRGFSESRDLYVSLLAAPCDIVILDIGLPGEDGFSIAERLHKLGTMGIIMLSARVDSRDRVQALRGGADIYLTKPVDLHELLAVISSLSRRLAAPLTQPAALEEAPSVWSLSADGWTLLDPIGFSLSLTSQERAFLQCLWKNLGQAVRREDLVEALGGDPYEYDYHRLDTLVSRLRRKVADVGLTLPVRAVRGIGYVVTPFSERGDE